jgi:hypothetical protein
LAIFAAIRRASSLLSKLAAERRPGNSQGIHRQNPRSFFARMRALVLAMTVRIILILVVASMFGPSLAFGSPACMTEREALAKFPKATHLYMRQNCWSDSAIAPVHSPRPPRAAMLAPSARPTLAVAPETVNSGTDAGAQCQYSPCE